MTAKLTKNIIDLTSKINYNTKEGSIMKTLFFYITFLALFLTSCTTSYYSSDPVPYDEVYYTAEKIPVTPPADATSSSSYSDTELYLDEYYSQGEYISEEGIYDVYEPAASESETYYVTKGATTISTTEELDSYLEKVRKEMTQILIKNKTIRSIKRFS